MKILLVVIFMPLILVTAANGKMNKHFLVADVHLGDENIPPGMVRILPAGNCHDVNFCIQQCFSIKKGSGTCINKDCICM